MSDAFQCDRCGGLFPGRHHQTIAWGPTESSSRSRSMSGGDGSQELCEACWEDFMAWFNAPAAHDLERESDE